MNFLRIFVGVVYLWAAAVRADVKILSPTNGAVFPAYATVTIEVEPDFKDGDNSVRYGIVGNEYYPKNMIAVRGTPPYSLTVSNLPAGTHRYAAWTSDRSPRDYVEIVVTNPPVHLGPYSIEDLHISPTGINNHGVVVGNSSDRAFTWDRGIIRWVPMPNSNRGAALAINDAGQITGLLYTTNGGKISSTAFLHSGGVTRPIEIPGADSSVGHSLSPRGDVVGTFLGEGGFTRGSFVYTAEGVLRTNEMMVFGDMNSWGVFAGRHDSGRHAVLWPPDDDMFLKQQLGPLRVPSGAEDINDAGQVAAWGRQIEDMRHNHHDAFLLSNYKLIKLTSGFYHEAYSRALNRWGQVLVEVTPTLHGPRDTFIGYGPKRIYLMGEDGGADLTLAVETDSRWKLESVVDINDHGQIVGTASNASGGLLLNPKPKVLETRVEGGELRMLVHERPGTTLKVQSSADFASWSMIATNSGGAAIRDLSIPVEEGAAFRFYRLINDEEYGNQVVGN